MSPSTPAFPIEHLVALAPAATPEGMALQQVSVRAVQKATCAHFGVPLVHLVGPSLLKPHTLARHVAVYVAWRVTGKDLPLIARSFGGRDRATLRNSIGRVEQMLQNRPEIARAVASLLAAFGGPVSDGLQITPRFRRG